MRKTYMMLLALLLTMMGATSAMGQKIYRAELDKSMFKAWDGWGANANEVANPDPIDDGANNFGCVTNLYNQIGAGQMVYGNNNVYYLWYADITGTKKLTIKATPGMQFRVLINRPEPVEGGDAHGGQTVELNPTADANGVAEVDLSSYEYVHLNAIKTGWGSPAGVVTALEIEGTVKPVTGILSMINNGDAEGEDLASFPVSWDGPNNGDTANDKPEIAEGGVDGSKCFKVVSFPNPTETWHTQFYIKSDEVLPQGTKWKLVMWIKADKESTITTSAQAQPRAWKGSFINEFVVGTEWKKYEWSGEISVADFQSIAFDLNNERGDDGNLQAGNGNCAFYFDNIEFGVDLGGSNPMSDVALSYGADVIRVDLADKTNMKELVAAAGGETLIFDNSCASVSWNGKNCNIVSVEGRPDGNLYVFLLDMDGEGGDDFSAEDATVTIAFKNPADDAHHLVFNSGKWAGQDVPDFSGMTCAYDFEVGAGEFFSYLWGAPKLEAAEPENGSFDLPADTKEFKITFNQNVDVTTVKAVLGKENLTVAPAEGYSKVVTLTRTASGDLAGETKLTITSATGEKGMELEEAIVLKYSFGESALNPNDKPEVLFTDNFGADNKNNYVPEGWIINSDAEDRQAGDYGSGCRVIAGGATGDNGFTKAIAYICSRGNNGAVPGLASYGAATGDEAPKLHLTPRTYTLTASAARWDAGGAERKLIMQVCDANDEVIAETTEAIIPDYKSEKASTDLKLEFTVETEGDYVLKFIPRGMDGNPAGYNDAVALGNIKLEYIPDVMGLVEKNALAASMEKAKAALEANSEDRYSGPAFTNLDSTIKEFDGKKMTAPSAFANAIAKLDAATAAMNDHHGLCDTYDPLPNQALQIVLNYAESKFAVTEIYANLVALVDKYGEKKTEQYTDPDTGETVTNTTLVVRELKDDAELTAAVDELKNAIAMAIGRDDVARTGKGMFTVGEPKMGSWEATCTGVAVLVDRIRQGAETLKALGVAEDDALIVAADKALTDNDDLAEQIKNRIKLELYGQLKNADNTLFAEVVDEATLETTTPTYNMSAFIKNPNLYNLNATASYKPENVPGWDVVDCRGFSTGWNDLGTDKIPVGIMFSNWSGSFTASQTITDLPAGVYTLTAGFGERMGEGESADATVGSYLYAKTSANVEDSLTAECPRVGQSFPYMNLTLEQDLVVTDGLLTIGVQAGQNSHVFFNGAKLVMKAPAAGFNYGTAYETVLSGIDPTEKKAATVRAIQLFDINGRRVPVAKKGIFVVKKYMSDGTVKTEKVIK